MEFCDKCDNELWSTEQTGIAYRAVERFHLEELKQEIRDHSDNGITLAGVEQLIDKKIKELK